MKRIKKLFIIVFLTGISLLFILNAVSSQETAGQLFEKALYLEEGKGELQPAIELYQQILDQYPDDREVQAKAQLHIGLCKEKLGLKEAIDAYQKVIENYPEFQNEVTVAKQKIQNLARVLNEIVKKPKFRKIQIPTKLTGEARLSPDGKKIALVTDEKLWIMPLLGNLGPDFPGVPVKLNTGDLEIDWCGLAWSSDGKWIAFNETHREDEQAGNQSLYIVSAEGGKPKKIHETYRDARIVNYHMSLSPQGKTMAFSAVEGKKQHIYTISTDGGVPKRLVDTLAREPVFSPDGKMIAYVEDDNCGRGGGGLWLVPAEGGIPKLVADAGMATSPIWSPGSDMLAFLDYENDDGDIYIIPLGQDGGAIGEKITIDRPEVKRTILLAGWTPDNKIGIVCRGLQEFALYTLPANGGKAAMVAHGGYPTQPRWSPDGKRIFHTNEKAENSGDWQKLAMAVVSSGGGKVMIVPIQSDEKIFKPGWGGGNRISPDGKLIVFAAQTEKDTSQHWQIWTLPVEGGKPTQITNTPGSIIDKYPCWSPDGKSIAFLRTRLSKNYFNLYNETKIYIVQINSGEPKPLTSESDSVSFCPIAWSPDGKHIAYYSIYENSDDEFINIIPVDGEEPRVIGKVQSVHVNRELAWSPDSKRIAFNGPKYSDKVVQVISIKDGSIVDIETDLVDTNIYHLDWSPDGTKFVFGGWQGGNAELWIMEDFLPLVKRTK